MYTYIYIYIYTHLCIYMCVFIKKPQPKGVLEVLRSPQNNPPTPSSPPGRQRNIHIYKPDRIQSPSSSRYPEVRNNANTASFMSPPYQANVPRTAPRNSRQLEVRIPKKQKNRILKEFSRRELEVASRSETVGTNCATPELEVAGGTRIKEHAIWRSRFEDSLLMTPC